MGPTPFRARLSLAAAAIALSLFAVAACDDEGLQTTPAPAADAGTDSAGGPSGDSGADAALDAGQRPDASLFTRLGKEQGITDYVNAVVAQEVTDPEIQSYFLPNTLATPPNGKPTIDQIKGCLVLMIEASSSDPTKGDPAFTYPAKVAGFNCRAMDSAHASLHIGGGTFDKFSGIAVGVAKAGGKLESEDLAAIDGLLRANKGKIVDPAAPDGGFFDAASLVDSSGD